MEDLNLKVNCTKTKCMIFTHKKIRYLTGREFPELTIHFSGNELPNLPPGSRANPTSNGKSKLSGGIQEPRTGSREAVSRIFKTSPKRPSRDPPSSGPSGWR